MICKHCNASIPENSMFCPFCGHKVEAEPVAAPAPTFDSAFRRAGSLDGSDSGMGAPAMERRPAAPQEDTGLRFSSSFNRHDAVTEEPVTNPVVAPTPTRVVNSGVDVHCTENRCLKCGRVLDPVTTLCNYCDKKPATTIAEKTEKKAVAAKAPKRAKKGLIVAACAAILVIAVLIVGFATNWFGATGPMVQIANAMQKTLTAGSFSVDFEISSEAYRGAGGAVEGTANVILDMDERELTLYFELTQNGETAVVAIYDNYLVARDPYGNYMCRNISTYLDQIFDAYETAEDFDLDELIDKIREMDTTGEMDEHINFNKLEDCIEAYAKKLNSASWLKENAGYSKKNDDGVTMYTFSPDIYKFVKASFSEFKKAFRDKDEFEEMAEELEDIKSASKETDIEIAFGVKGGKLVRIEGSISGSYDGLVSGNKMEIEVEFYDIGKTEIDTDELEDMLAEAKNSGYYY